MRPIELLVNRLILGDCIDVLKTVPSSSIDFVLTDPPYLVNYRPRDERRIYGDNSNAWLKPAFRELYRVLKPDSFCATFYGWPSIDQFMLAWKECGFRPVSHLAWAKSYASRAGYTKSFHEVGYLLAKGRPPKPQNPPSDVLPWEYTRNELHPNQKPVPALLPLIEAYSKSFDVVLDPFAGSGTTAVAAKAAGRRFILIEKDATYYQTAQRRLSHFLVGEASILSREEHI